MNSTTMLAITTLFMIALACENTLGQTGDPTVTTIYGDLRGSSKTDRLNRTYDVFLGVPFAKPPLGILRWEQPQPPEQWQGIREAKEFSDHCIQIVTFLYPLLKLGGNESEDCLYLNVYVPGGVSQASNLPVMMYLVGGAYFLGTGEMYPGEELAITANVIVITFNYRLGVLGFFHTGDEVSTGNYGLWDNKAALEWINANIQSFGGDPNRVTVFGQSAGGDAIIHAIQSEQTRHLIQRGIVISGAGLTGKPSNRTAQVLSELYDCNTTDSQEIVNCLRQIDGEAIYSRALTNVLAGAPVIDGVFITQPVHDSWEQGVGSDKDLMIGYTRHDSASFILFNFLGWPTNRTDKGNIDREEIESNIILLFGLSANGEWIVDELYRRYPGMNDTDNGVATEAYARLQTENGFGAGAFYRAEKHTEAQGTGNTYFYEFSHRYECLVGYPDWLNGTHLDDMYAIFGYPYLLAYREGLLNDDLNAADLELSRIVMKYYGNFAHTGNPNTGPHTVDLQWPQYSVIERQYLLQTPTPIIAVHDAERIYDFNLFLHIIPEMEGNSDNPLQELERQQFFSKMTEYLSEMKFDL